MLGGIGSNDKKTYSREEVRKPCEDGLKNGDPKVVS